MYWYWAHLTTGSVVRVNNFWPTHNEDEFQAKILTNDENWPNPATPSTHPFPINCIGFVFMVMPKAFAERSKSKFGSLKLE